MRRTPGLVHAAVSACLALCCAACLTPPALLPAPWVDAERCIALYPSGTERVELQVGEDTTLRGLFVPAGENAPVVLHLLESSGSAATLKYHYYALCEQLADLGYASLLIDYTGVGASSGSASPRHLARDADAMWHEALRRAGGDEKRVVLRGISIGTLAAAHVLSAGAQPRAVILIAPVRAETATGHFAAKRFNRLVGWMVDGLYRDVTDVDLVKTLSAARVPLLVETGSLDFFLSDEERERLYEAVVAARGTWVESSVRHVALALAGHEILPDELRFLPREACPAPELDARVSALLLELEPDAAAHFEDEAARERLRQLAALRRSGNPTLTAALAAGGVPGDDALVEAWRLDVRPFPQVPFDTLVAAVSLQGPTGQLPLEWIDRCGMPLHILALYGTSFALTSDPETIARTVQAALRGEKVAESVTVELGFESAELVVDPAALVQSLRATGASDVDVRAAVALVLLNAQRIPARFTPTERGPSVETWTDGTWRPLDLDPSAPDATQPQSWSFTGMLPRELGERATALVDG